MSFSWDWISFLLGIAFMAFVWPILASMVFRRNTSGTSES